MKVKMTFKQDLSKLNQLVKSVAGNNIVRIGILGSKVTREGEVTNAEIGAQHEFGSISKKIPERSFLRMPMFEKRNEIYKEIQAMLKSQLSSEKENINRKKVLKLIGIICENKVRDAFLTGGFGKWKPLKQSTIDAKGSDKILIDSRQLIKSITSDVK